MKSPNVCRFARLAAAVALLMASNVMAQDQCTDPASPWFTTLFCVAGLAGSAPPPEPPDPTAAADIKNYQLVFLGNHINAMGDRVRCLDGTRPAIWVDPAADPLSNKWLISLGTGGGSCNASVDGESCLQDYNSDGRELSSAHIATQTRDFGGIMNPDNAANVYADYHRIQIDKCSHDRFHGLTVRNVASSIGNYDLFQVGFSIVRSTMLELKNGLSFDTFVDDGLAGVATQQVDLPPLKDAAMVIFAGHSGAAHGLIHTIDRHASVMTDRWIQSDGVTPFAADVRVILDSHFLPALEGEAGIDTAGMWSIWDEVVLGVAVNFFFPNKPFDFDFSLYDVGGQYTTILDAWDAKLDRSCLDAHPVSTWKCRDKYHVMFNHVTTPMFIRQDLNDPNREHMDGNAAGSNLHRVQWAIPLGFGIDQVEFEKRIVEQAWQLILNRNSESELAATCVEDGCDSSGEPPTVSIALPDCSTHEGVFDNQMLTTDFDGTTLADAVMTFPALARNFPGGFGVGEAFSGIATDCPP